MTYRLIMFHPHLIMRPQLGYQTWLFHIFSHKSCSYIDFSALMLLVKIANASPFYLRRVRKSHWNKWHSLRSCCRCCCGIEYNTLNYTLPTNNGSQLLQKIHCKEFMKPWVTLILWGGYSVYHLPIHPISSKSEHFFGIHFARIMTQSRRWFWFFFIWHRSSMQTNYVQYSGSGKFAYVRHVMQQ